MKDLRLKPEQKQEALKFLQALFQAHLNKYGGYIELREIFNDKVKRKGYYKKITDIIKDLDNYLTNIYFGLAPRSKKQATKESESIEYLTCLWADVDYGTEGHRKLSNITNQKQARYYIKKFPLEPSIIVESGNGFHLYWLLEKSHRIKKFYPEENILRGIIGELKADYKHDITSIFRLPGSFNCKDPENIKRVKLEKFNPKIKYDLKDFEKYRIEGEEILEKNAKKVIIRGRKPQLTLKDLKESRLNATTIDTIINGDTFGRYFSRSERDQAVILDLLLSSFSYNKIWVIFNNPEFEISDKYLEKGRWGDSYLKTSIRNAEKLKELRKIKPKEREEKKALTGYIPAPLKREMLDRYLAYGEKLFPKNFQEEGFDEIESKHCYIYKKTKKEKGREEIIEWRISKEIAEIEIDRDGGKKLLDPHKDKISLELMQKSYLYSFLYGIKKMRNLEPNMPFNEKLKIIFQTKNPNARQRKELEFIENLLFYTTYRRVTKERNKEIETKQHLYSGIKTSIINGKKSIKVSLNKSYIEERINEETGLIKGQYYLVELPYIKPKTTKELFIRRSIGKLKEYGAEKLGKTIQLKVMTHFKNIGVPEYKLKKPVYTKEVWKYIEPTFKKVGHEIIKKEYDTDYKPDDVRGWKLYLRLAYKPTYKSKKHRKNQQKFL